MHASFSIVDARKTSPTTAPASLDDRWHKTVFSSDLNTSDRGNKLFDQFKKTADKEGKANRVGRIQEQTDKLRNWRGDAGCGTAECFHLTCFSH